MEVKNAEKHALIPVSSRVATLLATKKAGC